MTGSWQEGSSHVVCESTHLTSFAMLVDYSGLVAVSFPLCPVNLHVLIFSDTIYPAMHLYYSLFSFNLSYVFFFKYISLLPPSFPPTFLLNRSLHAHILLSALLSSWTIPLSLHTNFSPSLCHSLFPCPSSSSFFPPPILYDRNLLKKRSYSPFLPTWDVAFPYYAFLHP